MTCKNCHAELSEISKFCNSCGAKVVTKRITAKNLLSDIFQNAFGWDNKYFSTIRSLIIRPGELLREYLGGTRKKYVNPFTFLVIGMTLAVFTFNSFEDRYIENNMNFQTKQMKWQSQWMNENLGVPLPSEVVKKEQLAGVERSTKFILKYFNILVVLTLPLYTLLAFLVYRKPYNYGEHIVINCYIQGVSFISISGLFLISLVTHPLVYLLNSLLLLIFYAYAYGKLYKLSVGQSIFKVFLFLAILIAVSVAIMIVGFLVGMAVAYFGGKFG